MKRMMRMSVLLAVVLGMFANIGLAAEMKKVMIFHSRTAAAMAPRVRQGLEEAGFVEQKKLTSVQVQVTGDTDFAQLAAQVQEVAPEVIICATEYVRQVIAALQDSSIPIIVTNGVEQYVDAEGTPAANVSGVYSTLPDMVYNSYKFLQKVAPLKPGQQVVFLEIPSEPVIPKAVIVDALQRLQIPLKAVVDITLYEDWQQAILQYNDDPEVGWILRVSGPLRKQDGSPINTMTEVFPWERERLKKSGIMYWEIAVQMGTLCAFGIDLNEVGGQVGKMAARVLQGEDVRTIKAEYPQKVSIALNRKTATNLGIVFSLDVLNLANVIFDDYDGKQVIRK